MDSDNFHYVREDLGKSTFLEQVNAYYREDRYFDDEGIAYIRTEYPNMVDPMGMIEPRDKVDAGMERPPLENDVRAKFISIKELERIVVDDPRVGLYRLVTPVTSTYYMREDVNPRELVDPKRMYMYAYQFEIGTRHILVDANGHEYRHAHLTDMEKLTCLGEPFSTIYLDEIKTL